MFGSSLRKYEVLLNLRFLMLGLVVTRLRDWALTSARGGRFQFWTVATVISLITRLKPGELSLNLYNKAMMLLGKIEP